ncbi:Family of unknown function (DUF6060) [Microdochium nivale]|nr:Family of unknown function (DUF6060) [Microdochium nivale]
MRQSLTSTAAVAAAIAVFLAPLAAAECKNIDLVDADGITTTAPINVGLPESEGPQSDDQFFRVTEGITCISGNHSYAGPPRDGDEIQSSPPPGAEDCPVRSNYTYPMVLTLHPAIRHAEVSDHASLYALVRAKANPAHAALANFNETARFNFTLPEANDTVPANSESYWQWVSYYRCWQGTLGDCDGADEGLSGKNVTACAVMWEEGTEGLNAELQRYQGETFNTQSSIANLSSLSYPRASDFDWDGYRAELAENQTQAQSPGESGAAAGAGVVSQRAIGWGLGLALGVPLLL